jgi:putative effector of murein hydrolase
VGGEYNAEMVAVATRQRANDPRTVAAGVTVGVNAAAMGTAYLYEAQSEAAPHAALSMVALGIMTVVFSSIPPLARWVMRSVGA